MPIINSRPELFKFKQDIQLHFKTFQLPLETLPSYPDLFAEGNKPISFESVYLIDHNELPPSQEHLAERVRGLIDHHVDTGLYRPQCPHLYIVEKCGSAMTLVLEEFMYVLKALWDHELCWFTLAPIYMDSKIFSKNLYNVKWVDRDKHANNFLKYLAKRSMKANGIGTVDIFVGQWTVFACFLTYRPQKTTRKKVLQSPFGGSGGSGTPENGNYERLRN